MENLINETNEQLQGIIINLQTIGREYEDKLNKNAEMIENEKEKASKYKRDFAEAEVKISKMNADIQGFENDYNHLVEKFKDDELSNILVAANREISSKIEERKKKILKDQIAMNSLVQKAESVKTRLVKLYAEKKVLEYCYQQIVDAYDYYSTELGKIIDYSNEHRDYLCECYEEKEEIVEEPIEEVEDSIEEPETEMADEFFEEETMADDFFEDETNEEIIEPEEMELDEYQPEEEFEIPVQQAMEEEIPNPDEEIDPDEEFSINDQYTIDADFSGLELTFDDSELDNFDEPEYEDVNEPSIEETAVDEEIEIPSEVIDEVVDEEVPNEEIPEFEEPTDEEYFEEEIEETIPEVEEVIEEPDIEEEIIIPTNKDDEKPNDDDFIYIDNIELEEADDIEVPNEDVETDELKEVLNATAKELDEIIDTDKDDLLSYLEISDEDLEKLINQSDDLED